MSRRMTVADLVRDPGTGTLSHTRVWTNVVYAVTTAAFAWYAYHGWLSGEMFALYLLSAGGVGLVSKWLSLRFNPRG